MLNKVSVIITSIFLVVVLVGVSYLGVNKILSSLENQNDMRKSWAVREPPKVVTKYTSIQIKKVYLCGEVEEISENFDCTKLIGLSYDELLEKFDRSDGWQVQFLPSGELILTHRVNELCPVHREYHHFGIYQGKLAVFKGLLGVDAKIGKIITSKPITRLPQEMRIRLYQAMEFHNYSPQVQEEIRKELEFKSKKELYAVLENLDEL